MSEKPDYLLLGEILRPHGIQGELRVRLLTDYPERINSLVHVYVGANVTTTPKRYTVKHLRLNKGYGLLKLKEVEDRTQAETFRGLFVMIDLDHAVPLEEDEIYLYQLIGLRVQTDDGQELGSLKEVLETGANDVYIVTSDQYGEILIPAIDEIIVKTDTDAGILTVKLPEGLLPDSS